MNALRLLSLSILLLFGCESSPVPLGPLESAELDTRLIGSWDAIDSMEEGSIDALHIYAFSDNEHYLEYTHLPKKGDSLDKQEVGRFRGFITPLDGQSFFNIQDIDEDLEDRGYVIFWYELIDDNHLNIIYIDKDFSDVKTTDELRSIVSKMIAEDKLDEGDLARFVREPEKKQPQKN